MAPAKQGVLPAQADVTLEAFKWHYYRVYSRAAGCNCTGFNIKQITGTNGLYEARIQLGTDIWRVFCFFDKGRLVILLNGFQKKTQKTPKNEIEKALILMKEYYESRK
ncbi:MAG: type II toxin-antitoxin system RelE/ParE family toxin [Mangrovibacterium sp.]